MSNELLLFTNEPGFEKAVFYAKSKGYNWVGNHNITFNTLLVAYPRRPKQFAINIYYNNYNGQKEMQYQTKDFYIPTEQHKTRFTNIKQF